MKVENGWLIKYNPFTKKMIPFFIRVRSRDIVSVDPVIPEDVLKRVSTRWQLVQYKDCCDFTFYEYLGSWVNNSDPNAEVVGNSYSQSTIRYKMYKNGFFEVDGTIIIDGKLNSAANNQYDYTKTFYLPFAIPKRENIVVTTEGGQIEGVSISASLTQDKVTNQQLNPDVADTTKHWCLVTLRQITPSATNTMMDILRNSAKDGAGDNYQNFVAAHLPVHFKITSYWKSTQ